MSVRSGRGGEGVQAGVIHIIGSSHGLQDPTPTRAHLHGRKGTKIFEGAQGGSWVGVCRELGEINIIFYDKRVKKGWSGVNVI
jgi:hypothetical protein